MTANITAVLVLYRLSAEESACFQSLQQAIQELQLPADQVLLLLYDNSPERGQTPSTPITVRYVHDNSNGGVAAAYNAGLMEARVNHSPWLLLLDQDTAITAAYLRELLETTSALQEDVVAIVPRLVQGGSTHSPHLPPRLSHHHLPENVAGRVDQEISAFNSGAAIRVAAIRRFPERYWLDFLDHAIFHELQANGGRVWLMRARLEHRLSTESLGTEASLERYRNVVCAERDFYQDYGNSGMRLFYRLRRLKQALGQVVKVRDKRFALLSLQAALGLLGPTPKRPAV